MKTRQTEPRQLTLAELEELQRVCREFHEQYEVIRAEAHAQREPPQPKDSN